MSDRDDKAKQLFMDYQGTFGTAEGKRVLEHLSKLCYEHEATLTSTFSGTAYREGMRRVILYIRTQLAKNPYEKKQEKAKE